MMLQEEHAQDFLEEDGRSERPMRRRDRELSPTDTLRVAKAADYCVLSTVDEAGYPYGVPVNPVIEDEKRIYFHSTRALSRKADNMLVNPKVSLCFVAREEAKPLEFSVDYASAVISGRACLVMDEAERRHAALLICARHAAEAGKEKSEAYYGEAGRAITIWRVDIERASGKSRGWDRISAELAR